MTAGADVIERERDREPRGPRWGHALAIALELSIVAVLAAEHSWLGLVLCALYFYFSATCAGLFGGVE